MTHHPCFGPPPIEPLSDAAWSRIERNVWARLDATAPPRTHPASRRRRLVAIPLALAAAALLALVVRGIVPDAAHISSRVVSGAAAASTSFGDIEIELEPASAVVTRHEAQHPVAVIERGAAWFTVAPRARRPDFVVEAGEATIRVVGTRFRVARFAEHTSVEVEHGLVEVRLGGTTASVGAGQQWSSRSPGEVTPATAGAVIDAPAPAASAAAIDANAATTDASTSDPAVPSVDPAASPAIAASPPAALRPAPSRPPAIHRSPPRPPAPDGDASGAASSPRAPAPEPPGGAAPPDRDRAEYDRLAILEPASPEAALNGYLELARRPGPWADPALFAAARLAADRGDRRAKALLETYLARFPAGANATDAAQLLARLRGDR